jgi:hypothetical protein
MNVRLFVAALSAAALVSLVQPTAAHAQGAAGTSLVQQRVDAALRTFTLVQAQYAAGGATAEDVGTWGARWYQARRDAALSGSALTAAAQEWVDKMRAFERVVATRVTSGTASAADAQKALYFRLDAEIELARVRRHP